MFALLKPSYRLPVSYSSTTYYSSRTPSSDLWECSGESSSLTSTIVELNLFFPVGLRGVRDAGIDYSALFSYNLVSSFLMMIGDYAFSYVLDSWLREVYTLLSALRAFYFYVKVIGWIY